MKGKYKIETFIAIDPIIHLEFFIFRKLVTFGIQHELIRCINKYPICIAARPSSRQKLYSGTHHIDEICCKTGLTPAKIQEEIDTDPCIVIISK